MKIFFLLIVLIFSIIIAFPQTVAVKIKNLDDDETVLSSLQGEQVNTELRILAK
jgi:hypothetical protein